MIGTVSTLPLLWWNFLTLRLAENETCANLNVAHLALWSGKISKGLKYLGTGLESPYSMHLLVGEFIRKDSDAERDWGQEEQGMTEDEMAGWHYWLDGRESEWTPGVGDGQGGLACCDSWGRKESDTTEWLNWTELNWIHSLDSFSQKVISPDPFAAKSLVLYAVNQFLFLRDDRWQCTSTE